jgi:putative copper resistance protein D
MPFDETLIAIRAIHFAATLTTAGVVFFLVGVLRPTLAKHDRAAEFAVLLRRRLAWIAWGGLVVAVLSYAAWLVALAQRLSDGTITAVFRDGIVWILLSRTEFGTIWAVRVGLAVLLALLLGRGRTTDRPNGMVIVAGALAGSLAFVGHAGARADVAGTVNLLSDILHLLAVSAWVGALVPLALVLHAAGGGGQAAMVIAREATRRFSNIGMVSVATILATGIVDTVVLAGSVRALLGTEYGRLLIFKIALFFVMVSIAAINWRLLTPALVQESDAAAARLASRRLRNNALIEAGIGVAILGVVAIIGTLPPGLDNPAVAVVPARAFSDAIAPPGSDSPGSEAAGNRDRRCGAPSRLLGPSRRPVGLDRRSPGKLIRHAAQDAFRHGARGRQHGEVDLQLGTELLVLLAQGVEEFRGGAGKVAGARLDARRIAHEGAGQLALALGDLGGRDQSSGADQHRFLFDDFA